MQTVQEEKEKGSASLCLSSTGAGLGSDVVGPTPGSPISVFFFIHFFKMN